MTRLTFCSIVPPYLLDVLGQADDPDLADFAQRTLVADRAMRTARVEAPPTVEHDVANRSVYDAGGAETDRKSVV